MATDSIRSLVRVSSESGPLMEHLLSMPSNKRSERLRTLAYMGLMVERGLLNISSVLPVGAPTNAIHQAKSTETPGAKETQKKKKEPVALFDDEDLEHIGM